MKQVNGGIRQLGNNKKGREDEKLKPNNVKEELDIQEKLKRKQKLRKKRGKIHSRGFRR